ncbi:MAG: DNA alkylation repair protein, partial [Acidobacteria bacterium]|nr:DNA alkylation repair protein [Candidatus Sulfomarinibacter sp. MAG AM2]
MTTLVYVIAYLGIVFFLIAVAARFVFWSRMPMHLRWELYPVAHEGGGRAAYGGSYLEESDWWQKKRQVSLLGELKVMVPEILFLVALREHNPKLWTRSFPFHFGLYLVAAATILMMVGGVVAAVMPASIGGPAAGVLAILSGPAVAVAFGKPMGAIEIGNLAFHLLVLASMSPPIVGRWILAGPPERKQFLYRLLQEDGVWRPRLAIVSTVPIIRSGEVPADYSLSLLDRVLGRQEPLIVKAVSWSLRDMAKHDRRRAQRYLRDRDDLL